MAIYDNNGTVNSEIMAIYDNDGTTNHLICEDKDYNVSLLYSSTGNWVTRTYTTTKDYEAIVVFVNATETLNNSYHKASVSGSGLSSLKTLTYSDEGTRQGKTVIYSGKNIPTGTTITMAWCYEGSCSVIGFN